MGHTRATTLLLVPPLASDLLPVWEDRSKYDMQDYCYSVGDGFFAWKLLPVWEDRSKYDMQDYCYSVGDGFIAWKLRQ